MSDVKLVAITHPVVDKVKTAEEFIAYCARVSNPTNQLNNETAERLLQYLVKNKHWSPFEMVHVVMEINTTRDIGRQILRHRSFSFQEFSQRYAEVDSTVFAYREARLQDQKNRQNSVETSDSELLTTWEMKQQQIAHEARLAYKWAIDNGVAKEQARAVLPEGMTMSRMYMSGSLRSWLHYCELRCGNGTQKEHRLIAEECRNIIALKFPSISNIIMSQ